jgi:chromosome segregation ATPase
VDVVTAPDGVLGLLGDVYIADDLASARSAWNSVGKSEAPTFVTRDGDVLTRYVLRGGSGAKRSRLELVAERDAAASKLATVTTQIERTRFALAEKRGQLETAKSDAAAALTALREYDAALAAQSEQLGRFRIQLEAAQAEWERLSKAVELSSATVATAEEEVEKARKAHDQYAATPRPMLDVSAREGVLAEVEAARAHELELRIQLETIRERVRSERARADQLASQLVAERAAAEEQARLTVIAGSRDDIGLVTYRRGQDRALLADAARMLSSVDAARRFDEVPTHAAETLHDDVAWELGQLRAAGIEQVAVVDLTLQEFGISVVRVVIPGLEGMHDAPGFTPGARLRARLS